MLTGLVVIVLVAGDFAVCDHEAFQGMPCVIWAESLYYCFWSDHRDYTAIYATRIRNDGTVVDSVGRFIYLGDPTDEISAAYDGKNILIAFREHC